MIVAIIPARGGSKRIPGKNIKLFAGRPMISYSILAARESALFDRIIVSTDSSEIAQVAKQYGAEIPFMRPSELADDFTGTDEVILHATEWLEREDARPDYVCCVYATSPFLKAKYIRQGFEALRSEGASSSFSVTTYSYPIFRSLKITPRGRVEMLWPEYLEARSQDLPEAYHDAGQFYWIDVLKFLETHQILSDDTLPIILPRRLVQDVDTLEDWVCAERMYINFELVEK